MEGVTAIPQSLPLAKLVKPAPSLWETLVGAFNRVQAQQQYQVAQQQVKNKLTWTGCSTLYIVVIVKAGDCGERQIRCL